MSKFITLTTLQPSKHIDIDISHIKDAKRDNRMEKGVSVKFTRVILKDLAEFEVAESLAEVNRLMKEAQRK